jgi:hypothetical protein
MQMNYRKQRAAARRHVISIEVLEEYRMVPVGIEVASAARPGRRVLPAVVGRLRCGQEAPKKVEPAPLIAQVIGA